MSGKYAILKKGTLILRPKWKSDDPTDNQPFQTVDDALDWGDEITPGAGKFLIVGLDEPYLAIRTWVTVGEGHWQSTFEERSVA